MKKEKIDSWLSHYQAYAQVLPVFLLTLGCGIDSGVLMTISVLSYLIINRLYHEKIGLSLLKSRLFLFSLGALAFWLLCLLIPMYWTGGKYSLLLKYVERALPMIILCFIGRKQQNFFQVVWLGMIVSVAWYVLVCLWHPAFYDGHRLAGGQLETFHNANGLAGILSMLLPAVFFGLICYGRDKRKKLGLIAAIFYILGLGIIVLTGSRNGLLTSLIVIIILALFLVKVKDKFFLKLIAIFLAVGLGAGICLAPQMVSQRVNCEIKQDGRIWLFQVAEDIYEKHPNTGIGLGNWQTEYRIHYELPGREKNMASPHNIFLQTLNESGRIGLFGFLAMFFFQFAVLLHNGFIQRKETKKILRWTTCSFLILITTVVFGMMDYSFFDRHFMHLYWFYWGLAIYEIYYSKDKELLR